MPRAWAWARLTGRKWRRTLYILPTLFGFPLEHAHEADLLVQYVYLEGVLVAALLADV